MQNLKHPGQATLCGLSQFLNGVLPIAMLASLFCAFSSAFASPPPGVVIDHIAKENRDFIGSPSLTRLPSGELLASHDYFGPGKLGGTKVFVSKNKGRTWTLRSTVPDQDSSSLFVYEGMPHLLGRFLPLKQFAVRRSADGGVTWTEAKGPESGLILGKGATPGSTPVPVVVHGGRIWRAAEHGRRRLRFPYKFTAFMISAPLGADLLKAKSWKQTQHLKPNLDWLGGKFGGWLEGNAVVTPQGVVNVLRVQTEEPEEYAALMSVSEDGRRLSFDAKSGFVRMPGGAKKFCISPDPQGKGYWALANVSPKPLPQPAGLRNTVSLLYSENLREWKLKGHLLHRENHEQFAFQYMEFIFDGDDLLFVSRTAWDGAFNHHDANYFTFHRVKDFRAIHTGNAVPELMTDALK
jgi:hypothetical protein